MKIPYSQSVMFHGKENYRTKKEAARAAPLKDILFLNTKSIDCILGEHISRFQQ